MAEDRATRLKRLAMRSSRRGMREMDLILMAFVRSALVEMPDGDLALYDSLLKENDQDLYAWITGHGVPPTRYEVLLDGIRKTAHTAAVG